MDFINFFKTQKIYILILLVFFVFTGVVVFLVLNKKPVVQDEVIKAEKGIQKPAFLNYLNKGLGYGFTYPSNWELNELADGSLKIYPKDLYNPNYEHENILLIEPKLSTSSVFEQGEKSGCKLFENTFVAGLPAKMCEETGLNLKTSYYRITEVSQTSWGKLNMISLNLNSGGESRRSEYEKIISELYLTTKPYSENDKKTWKKYKNSNYGFELSYPAKYGQYNFTLKTEEVSKDSAQPLFSINFIATPTTLPFQEMAVPEYMMDFEVRKGQKLSDWLKNQESAKDYVVSPFETQIINGVSVTTYTTTNTLEKDRSTDLWAVWEVNDNFYLYACNLNKYGNFCRDILNSIKIIENTSAWKTYKNDEYGFEFEYPASWKLSESNIFNKIEQNISVVSSRDYTSRISIMPNGGFDHGWPSTKPIILKIKFGGESANKIYWDDKLYQTVTFLEPKVNWSSNNRIEASFGKDGIDKELIRQILATFKFIK